jgi:NTE family protein
MTRRVEPAGTPFLRPYGHHLRSSTAAPAPVRLAVVVGSGGVRSVAALGLFEALNRAGIRPDLVVGCSAGAIFGALVASGFPLDECAQLATRLWTRDVTSEPRRLALAQMIWPRLGRFGPDFALRRDERIIRQMTLAFGDRALESLPVPLRVTATDAATGALVILDRGPVVTALRASVALPFMFAAVRDGERRLVDGFLADPLPIQAAADAGCVIAMGLEAPMPRRIDRPSRMLSQLTSTMTNNLMEARVQAAQAAGTRLVTVVPHPRRPVGLFETAAMPHLIEVGREAAEAAMPRILAELAELDSARQTDPAPARAA